MKLLEKFYDDSKRIRYFLIFAIASLFVYSGVVQLLMTSLHIEELKASLTTTLIYSFGFSMSLLFLYFKEVKENLLNFNVKNIGWIIGGIVTLYILQLGYGFVYEYINPASASANGDSLKDTLYAFPLYVLAPSLFMPFIEEMFFRKMMFGFLEKWFGFISASIVSSLAFAMLHFDPTNFILFFLIGMLFVYVYDRTNNIIVPFLIHSVMNTVIILFSII